MTNTELTEYAKKLCKQLFGIEYHSYVKWNRNLRRSVGRFNYKLEYTIGGMKRTNHYYIDIQTRLVKDHPALLPKVVGHELCHYYCYVTGKPSNDSDDYFQNQLKKYHLPSVLNANKLTIQSPRYYVMYCPNCYRAYLWRGKTRTEYFCTVCRKRNLHRNGILTKPYQLKAYGYVKLHGTYKNLRQVQNVISKMIKKQTQSVQSHFNNNAYQKANQAVTNGQQMKLFA